MAMTSTLGFNGSAHEDRNGAEIRLRIAMAKVAAQCGNLPGVSLRSTPGYTHTAALQPDVYTDPLVSMGG